MSIKRECDLCGKDIKNYSLRETHRHVEVEGIEFGIKIEVENHYKIPKPEPKSTHMPSLPRGIPTSIGREENLDLCRECFNKVITALKKEE